MVELVFGEEADEALTRLEADPRQRPLLLAVLSALRLLAEAPYHRRNNRLTYLGARRISLPEFGWMVLWTWYESEVLVQYIGPTPNAEGAPDG